MTTRIETHSHDHHDHDHAHDHAHAGADRMLWLKTAILLGLGVYFVVLILNGTLTNYINNRFTWLSYLAAAIFLLTGIVSAHHLLTAHRGKHDHDHDHDGHDHDAHAGHNHGSLSWGILAITALPLVLGTLVPSRPLGAEAVSGGVNVTAAEGAQVQTLTIPPLERNVLDWLRAFNREPDLTAFDGQPVDVIGFIYTEPDFDADTFMVARFTVSCCVADANAIGLPVYWEDIETMPQGEWVRVTGTLQKGDFRGESLPIVQASAVEVVAQPDHPYLYP